MHACMHKLQINTNVQRSIYLYRSKTSLFCSISCSTCIRISIDPSVNNPQHACMVGAGIYCKSTAEILPPYPCFLKPTCNRENASKRFTLKKYPQIRGTNRKIGCLLRTQIVEPRSREQKWGQKGKSGMPMRKSKIEDRIPWDPCLKKKFG